MSKITFRADDDLVSQLEAFDASKSEVMREALRQFLGESASDSGVNAGEESRSEGSVDSVDDRIDALIEDRIDALLDERLGRSFTARSGSYTQSDPRDVNVNISVDGVTQASDDGDGDDGVQRRKTEGTGEADAAANGVQQCPQCGENVSEDHVYCPNCGEKATRRVFCDCGDELRSDWGFCPSCGRRTPAADVLDRP